jgi:hypothetical protein
VNDWFGCLFSTNLVDFALSPDIANRGLTLPRYLDILKKDIYHFC